MNRESYETVNHLPKKDLDILIVRELTGGLYFGEPRGIIENESPKRAFNTMVYNFFHFVISFIQSKSM